MPANGQHQVREFLYMDPDTNMMVCMIADNDGFRPAHAHEELLDTTLQQIHKQSNKAVPSIQTTQGEAFGAQGFDEIDSFFQQYDHAYLRPSA